MADESIAELGLDDTDLFCLKESIVGGQMIAVVGPDAVDIEFTDDNGTEQSGPLYRFVARRLLAKFDLPADDAITEQPWALFAAVGRIMGSVPSRRTKQIPFDISMLVADYMRRGRPGGNLRSLVKVAPFRLFVSMTPDDLLDRAITENDPACELRTASYSPQAASEIATDVPRLKPNQRGIFRLFGSCAGGSRFAHHEEDVLEYLHGLQSDGPRRCATVLTEMRRSHKIFVGCDLPDWLGRPLLRLVNDDRLYVKETREFLQGKFVLKLARSDGRNSWSCASNRRRAGYANRACA
jgi:hypothetical protein